MQLNKAREVLFPAIWEEVLAKLWYITHQAIVVHHLSGGIQWDQESVKWFTNRKRNMP